MLTGQKAAKIIDIAEKHIKFLIGFRFSKEKVNMRVTAEISENAKISAFDSRGKVPCYT